MGRRRQHSSKYVYCVVGVVISSLAWGAILLQLHAGDPAAEKHHFRRIRPKFVEDEESQQRSPSPPTSREDKWQDEVRQLHLDPNEPIRIDRQDEFLRRNGPTLSAHEIDVRRVNAAERGADDKRAVQRGYDANAFNQVVSDRIGFRRDVPDTRNILCASRAYPSSLPRASVIICFHNEAPSALLRTAQSVLDRTPSRLLKEVILIDDFSNRHEMDSPLKAFLKSETKVRYHRNEERIGLMRARNAGARLALGDVIVFLDSHCEVNRDWLEPLLARIGADSTRVVCPIIDMINPDTFSYNESPIVKGGFNWGMNFNWEQLEPHEIDTPEKRIQAIRSPTMAGGLFAIDRKYFHRLGAYDEGMESWGSENLEMSFRVWMCGGTLEIIPCSRVGHIFRRSRPYDEPSDAMKMLRNQLRLVHVWLDDYKKYYYQVFPNYQGIECGDVSGRRALRERLGCKSFEWYIKTVYPSVKLPADKNNEPERKIAPKRTIVRDKRTLKIGQIVHEGSRSCLDIAGKMSVKGALVELNSCAQNDDQTWIYTGRQEVKLGRLCLSYKENRLSMIRCDITDRNQVWELTQHGMYHSASNTCLEVSSTNHLALGPCIDGSRHQMFTWLELH